MSKKSQGDENFGIKIGKRIKKEMVLYKTVEFTINNII